MSAYYDITRMMLNQQEIGRDANHGIFQSIKNLRIQRDQTNHLLNKQFRCKNNSIKPIIDKLIDKSSSWEIEKYGMIN